MDSSYWIQDHLQQFNVIPHSESLSGDPGTYFNHVQNEDSTINIINQQQGELGSLGSDLFQPDEIFQLDQPLQNTDYGIMTQQHNSETERSPPMLLDLGSGTIHRDNIKHEPESCWLLPQPQLLTVVTDESNSASSKFPPCSPDNPLSFNIGHTLEDPNTCELKDNEQYQNSSMRMQCSSSAIHVNTTVNLKTIEEEVTTKDIANGIFQYKTQENGVKMEGTLQRQEMTDNHLLYYELQESRLEISQQHNPLQINSINNLTYSSTNEQSYKSIHLENGNNCDLEGRTKTLRFNCVPASSPSDSQINTKEFLNISFNSPHIGIQNIGDIDGHCPVGECTRTGVTNLYCERMDMHSNCTSLDGSTHSCLPTSTSNVTSNFKMQCSDVHSNGYHFPLHFPHVTHH